MVIFSYEVINKNIKQDKMKLENIWSKLQLSFTLLLFTILTHPFTLHNTALVLRQRNLQFAGFDLAVPVLGATFFCSIVSQGFNFIQFSFRCSLSLQYQHSKSRFKDPSTPGLSWGGWGFPRVAC